MPKSTKTKTSKTASKAPTRARKPAKKPVKTKAKPRTKGRVAFSTPAQTPKVIDTTKPAYGLVMGVRMPFDLNDFSALVWPEVLEFYATWKKQVDWGESDPWMIQPYMFEFAKLVADHGVSKEWLGNRVYCTAEDWIERCFAHWGMDVLAPYTSPNTFPSNARSIKTSIDELLAKIFNPTDN